MNHNIIKRVYVDTSVIGGMFDIAFEKRTKPFWSAVKRGEIVIIISDVVDGEVELAPKKVRDFYDSLPKDRIELFFSTEESDNLAAQYIAEKVVGPAGLDDCKHIAIATLAHADALVRWDSTLIPNVTRILGYNSVNKKMGYSRINIRTPYEVINDQT